MQPSGSHDPIRRVNAAQEMARKCDGAEGTMFNKVTMVCMGVMALASVAQALHLLLRDLNRKENKDRGRG